MSFKAFSVIKESTVGNSSGISLADLIGIKDKTNKKTNTSDKDYRKAFQTGLYYLIQFTEKKLFDRKSFEMTEYKLKEAIRFKSDKPEPYFYLAWLFAMVREKETAVKYMKIAVNLNPDLDGLDGLKKQISEL